MNLALVADIVSWIMLLGGSFFCVVGGVGLVRMPDFYTRMHGASITETLGAGLMLVGLIVQAGFTLVAAKLGMIAVLIFLTSPAATHALAKAALARGLEPLLAAPDLSPSKPPPSEPPSKP